MLQDPNYKSILKKQDDGQSLSSEERSYLEYYDQQLKTYYERMPAAEKERFREFSQQWDAEAQLQQTKEPSDVLETNARGILPGKKYRLYNGIYGFVYGSAAIPLLGLEDTGVAYGLPFLMAGGSLLLPVINPKKYENMSFNSVLLNRHGKFYGLVDGAAAGILLFGTNSEAAGKATLAMAIGGSIAMGELGFQLGKRKDWTEGRIQGYTHYAAVSLLFGSGLYASFANDFNGRTFGGVLLASQAAGYLLADKLYKKYQYSRGDVIASGSLTFFSTVLGLGLVSQVANADNQTIILLPTASLLAGSLLSHNFTRGLNLSPGDGWKIGYTSFAGGLVGLGAALLINPDEETLYLLLPAAGGLIGWGAMLSSVRKGKTRAGKHHRSFMSYNITPHNFIYNRDVPADRIDPDHPAKPVVSVRLHF